MLDLAVTTGIINRTGAALIAATRLPGFSLADATRPAGLSHEVAKKRRQRAEAATATPSTTASPNSAPPSSTVTGNDDPR